MVLLTPMKIPDQHRPVSRPGGDDQYHDGEGREVGVHGLGDAEGGLQPGRAEDGEQGDEGAPAGEDQSELDRAEVHRERRVPQDGEESPVVTERGQ
jgi:hypothetical protein